MQGQIVNTFQIYENTYIFRKSGRTGTYINGLQKVSEAWKLKLSNVHIGL